MPSSSSSSRTSAASRDSPGSTLPPGNSHRPARCRPAPRRVTRMRPPASRSTPATTRNGVTGSGNAAVAVLVFLARSARARIVAPDLGPFAMHRRLARLGLGISCLAEVVLARHEPARFGMLELHRARLRGCLQLLLLLERLHFFLAAHAHPRERLHDLVLDSVEHALEQLECLALELLLRLLLRITAQVDALAQVVHAREMFLPAIVEHAQHDVLLERTHDFGTDHRLLFTDQAVAGFENPLQHRIRVGLGLLVEPATHAETDAEFARQFAIEAVDVPLLVDRRS